MFFKKKKSEKENVVADIDLIKENTQRVDVLLVFVKENEQLTKDLKRVQEDLKYLNPTTDETIQKLDQKIADVLGDFKIYLNKHSQKEDLSDANSFIRDLDILIAERKSKLMN